MDGDWDLLFAERKLLVRVLAGTEHMTGLGEQLINALLVMERLGRERRVPGRVYNAVWGNLLRTEVIDGDGALGVRVQDELDMVFRVMGGFHKPDRFFSQINQRV